MDVTKVTFEVVEVSLNGYIGWFLDKNDNPSWLEVIIILALYDFM
jgi:hypothetical protein